MDFTTKLRFHSSNKILRSLLFVVVMNDEGGSKLQFAVCFKKELRESEQASKHQGIYSRYT